MITIKFEPRLSPIGFAGLQLGDIFTHDAQLSSGSHIFMKVGCIAALLLNVAPEERRIMEAGPDSLCFELPATITINAKGAINVS